MACVDFGADLVAQWEVGGVDLERDGGCAGWLKEMNILFE